MVVVNILSHSKWVHIMW